MLWLRVQISGLVESRQRNPCGDCHVWTARSLLPYSHLQLTYCVPLSFAEEDAGPNLPVADRLDEK